MYFFLLFFISVNTLFIFIPVRDRTEQKIQILKVSPLNPIHHKHGNMTFGIIKITVIKCTGKKERVREAICIVCSLSHRDVS